MSLRSRVSQIKLMTDPDKAPGLTVLTHSGGQWSIVIVFCVREVAWRVLAEVNKWVEKFYCDLMIILDLTSIGMQLPFWLWFILFISKSIV